MQCTPETAAFAYCRPGPAADSAAPGQRCTLMGDACLTNQRGVCMCNESNGCPKSADRCFPAPDCPPPIKTAAPRSRCLDSNLAFTQSSSSSSTGGPAPPVPLVDGGAGRPAEQGPTTIPCACGCVGCAEVCDGRGPVIGASQKLTITPSDTPPTGQLGFMIRARGRGRITLQPFAGGALPVAPNAIASQTYTVSSDSADPAGVDHFVDLLPTAGTFDLVDGPLHIERIELSTSSDAVLEIDCVVPFVIPPPPGN
jgi:hypothetical protein